MDVQSYVLLSHEMALRRRLDVTANNIANMNTTGFKRESPVFRSYVERMNGVDQLPAGGRSVAYVLDYGTVHDLAMGPFKPTGNPLDAAIAGDGYFAVQLPDGTAAYTRNGHFEIDVDGLLVNGQGYPVMDADNQPLRIEQEQIGRIEIAADGSLVGPQGQIGRIGIFRFGDETGLAQRGDGLFAGDGGQVAAPGTVSLKAGGLEESNVRPVVETADMVELLRSYQSSRRMADSINEMRRSAIQRLGRVE